MRILLFGKSGQVGWELQRSLALLGEVRSLGTREADFSCPDQIVEVIREYKPSHIVNAAAYTAVDKAESEESLADIINGHTVGVIAEESKKINAKLVHYSTDYVFDGAKSGAFFESDKPNPLNAYGRSKLLGEKYISEVGCDAVVLRVSWIYGARGNNFFRSMIRLGAEREYLNIVDDQVGSPTWCRHIAEATAHIVMDKDFSSKSGVYHMASQGSVTWCGFAQEIFDVAKRSNLLGQLKVQEVIPILSKDYPAKAIRPLNSKMNSSKLLDSFRIQLPSWQDSLQMVLNDLLK